MTPVKCSVAAVVRHPDDPALFLAVRRPPDDDRLPDVWGLPAVTLRPGELPEAGVRRVGREKLGVELEPVSFVGVGTADRGEYRLVLMDVEARLVAGEPSVADAVTTATKYVDQCWTRDLSLLADAARRGSLCSQVLLEAEGMAW